MPTYNATIKLQNGVNNDYAVLHHELQLLDFETGIIPDFKKSEKNTTNIVLEVSRSAVQLQDITTDIIAAARKTGKDFTFTVIKDK